MSRSPQLVAVLRVVDPAGDHQFALIDRPVLHIGSAGDECGLTLTGPGIAAAHCSLRWQGTRWILHDRGAAAGTYLNSRRIREPTALCPGDRISIVHHLIHFTTLPSLELPHVLARLRDQPLRWIPTRPRPAPPHTPAPPPRRRTSLLATCTALLALGLATSASEPDLSPEPAIRIDALTSDHESDLSPEPAIQLSAFPTTDHSPDRSPGEQTTSPDLSLEPADQLATVSPDLLRDKSRPSTLTSAHTFVTEPPLFELPLDAVGLGRPTDGAILHALQLPPSTDYAIRCPAHAHATAATIGELMHALATVRNRGYTGELVVGDLSRLDGGQYGPHKSHQSGRDVDLWLPIRGGRYERGCPRCGTDMCRPEPGQVDWHATWKLIQSLAERGAVEDIFLDWTLHPALASAARDLGVPDDEIQRQIQHPIRGRPTLIKHSDGHVHHLHVRFRDPPPALP